MNLIANVSIFILLFGMTCCKPKSGDTNQLTSKKNKSLPIEIPNVFPQEGLTDAHTIIANGRLYLFGGHDQSWDTDDTWRMDRWEIRSTDNLIDWKKEGVILPTETYIGDLPNCWAGDITERNGKYYWYFSNRNISTGVMVANSPIGPFTDALGKPLLPNGIIGKGHPYDPEIFEENGVYTMFFGAGHYYSVILGDDMISLAEKPQPVIVTTKDGKDKWTADKSTVFKRNDIYYLAWGANYAMSKQLRGPYIYEGDFLAGGHNNVFQWNGQWYVVTENKDISLFYRGVSLKPLFFNEDGTIDVPDDDADYPNIGRDWTFKHSKMGWNSLSGGTLDWKVGSVSGNIEGHTVIESSNWLITDLTKCKHLVLQLKNNSRSTQARISLALFNPKKGKYWSNPEIDWSQETQYDLDISSNDTDFKEYQIDLSQNMNLKSSLKRIRIEPALGVNTGSWEIKYIGFK
ncbi:family 43 glycosylhydrolase [Ancylomarina sp. 16SWW S1-10-2]|uniref:family 43 glycosylhydrolase n=1 Tax=Ancylomarina sp. 16SWW S1-10-2 TaxID=2499681 RepID=UPI0012AD3E78|nr:family 43 glycosylhydrolase [Ancylomarina sp. 16SWW S1-10-2]MRT91971.1 hypothetical protein [Ancylomarina sp. 16SWW S1-10-2]